MTIQATTPHCDPLIVEGAHFLDTAGRSIILRGVNLGGDCKVPFPYGGTNYPSDFSDHREVSFIGRPFPLEEADAHLGRLRHWGFNVVRLLTTWEAVEHAGPGIYDEAYLDYLVEVCRRAGEHGLYVFVDFHQDVWSRMTGGSGAPGWTFEAVGLDFTRFHAADAAHVMQNVYDYAKGGWQDAYPQMSWGANHRLPPTGIMWTLFWTGRIFTPQLEVEGRNVQDFLQGRYLGAMDAVARRVAHLPNVIGFDTLNEPVTGWMGRSLGYRHVAPTAENPLRPRIGLAMSPLDCLLAARGVSVEVPLVERDPITGALSADRHKLVNAAGVPIWMDGVECPFERAGAYRLEGGRAVDVRDDFFQRDAGRVYNVADDAYRPLFEDVARTIRVHNPYWAIFAELEPYAGLSGKGFPDVMPERSVNASHWYDFSILYTKRFSPDAAYDFSTGETAYGRDALRDVYCDRLGQIMEHAERFSAEGAPTLIGEFGIPYDLEHGAAFAAWRAGDRSETPWEQHIGALSLMYEAMDALKIHSTQWNYTASNRNDLMIGDGWNQEDLSIFSVDQMERPEDPDSGGRAVAGFCRPYVRRAAGVLQDMRFDTDSAIFECRIAAGQGDSPSEIYIPRFHFGENPLFEIVSGDCVVDYDATAQVAYVQGKGELHLRVSSR
ncbi:cellulase family glycosylhydrolase [Sphingobium sp. H39-3-25]|uniref:glycoside hydrolase family 5 protein n=1 Tax=Sphingobium arseniciresistens TaxID=3030834 RepID=UPI0023B9F546|nr:cellulase family glycosylhydrolase [Sphingobium arseniciresistens]